jgi:hypothetical protein
MNLQQILATKAPPQMRGLRYIENVTPHFSSLTDYIDSRFGYDTACVSKVDKVVGTYCLGAVDKVMAEHYGTVLPRIRPDGQVVGGSVLYYDTVLGKVLLMEDITDNLYNWYCDDYYVEQDVFFGEHLIAGNPIAVVQDEMTAVIGSIAEPQVTWISPGYCRDLTDRMLDKIYGRRVVLFTNDYNNDYWQEHFGNRFMINDNFFRQNINDYLIGKTMNNHF